MTGDEWIVYKSLIQMETCARMMMIMLIAVIGSESVDEVSNN